ncbi:hypothetical protein N7478_004882 [Penicillium angulare]|uniref:uncharacterized protein n=1 Tax=Penicillium angulare TaxID=116970 RepID=UPI002541FC23|nr:uncharacterized protein N7478_004882 [Penicillium angulare]KAJ5279510.1 hypothetical protein N7478_004882 [Penicillium angulare]
MRILSALPIAISFVLAATIPIPLFTRDEPDPVNHLIQIESRPSESNFQTINQHMLPQSEPWEDTQGRDSILRNQDRREKLVAMCEAGFVADCQLAIEEASSVANNDKAEPKLFLGFEISLPSVLCEKAEGYPVYWNPVNAFGLCMVLVVVAVICSTNRRPKSSNYAYDQVKSSES